MHSAATSESGQSFTSTQVEGGGVVQQVQVGLSHLPAQPADMKEV